MILKAIRAASYLFFAPSPTSEKGKITGGDALLITKDASAAFGWAALLVLIAKAFGVNLSGDDSQKVVEAMLILWPLLVAVVSTIVRWFQDSKPKPLPTPPPSPLPPNGIRSDKPQSLSEWDSSLPEHKPDMSFLNDYDFERRPPGGGPNGPK